VRGMAVTATEAQLTTLLGNFSGEVKYAERDAVVTMAGMSQTGDDVPWNLDRINARWGLDNTYNYTATGEGVNIYVVDSGVRVTHAEFGHADGSLGSRATSVYDFVDNDSNADDCNGCGVHPWHLLPCACLVSCRLTAFPRARHGTHVAGTAAGLTYGAAKEASVYGLRVLDCEGSGWGTDIIAALEWIEENFVPPAVVTMSLGMDGHSHAINAAVDALVDAGVVVVRCPPRPLLSFVRCMGAYVLTVLTHPKDRWSAGGGRWQ
jgi:subtilisin family serine protease